MFTVYYWGLESGEPVKGSIGFSGKREAFSPSLISCHPFRMVYQDDLGYVNFYDVDAPGFMQHADTSRVRTDETVIFPRFCDPALPYRCEFIGDVTDPEVAKKVEALRTEVEGDMTPSAAFERAGLRAGDDMRVLRTQRYVRELLKEPRFPIYVTIAEMNMHSLGTQTECLNTIKAYLYEQNKLDKKRAYRVDLAAVGVWINSEEIE